MTKMKKPLFFAFLALIFSAGCSRLELAGVSATRYQDAPGSYSSVVVDGNIRLEYSPAMEMIEIVTDANVLPYVDVKVQSGTLTLDYRDGARFSSGAYETIVRIPLNADLQTLRIMNGARCDAGDIKAGTSRLRFDAESGSAFEISSISADDVSVNLGGGSSFKAGTVTASIMSMNLSDGSYAGMDGTISYADVIMEDGSTITHLTGSDALVIDRFNGSLSDGSMASFYSDGIITGTIRDGSSIINTGNAVMNVVKL